MKSTAARFLARTLRLGAVAVAGLLLLPSCGKKDESAAKPVKETKRSGTKPSPGSAAAGTDAGRNAKKSGQRDGKTSSAPMIKTASGLQYQVLKEGDGPKPASIDTVTVNYHGTLEDGTVFDSSVDRNEPASFPVDGVIAGWIEGLQLMSVGSKYRFVIPPDLAYGERGAGGVIGPNQTLIFEVELLSIQ